jgi:amidohydrolase
MDFKRIWDKAEAIKGELIGIRRDIHAHPELGFKEYRTSALVAMELKKLNIEVMEKVGITGVVGILRGKKPGKTLLIRVDMDCLPLEENNDAPYKSKHPGLMHACGHDAHTTFLLGAAKILREFQNDLHGNIKFVFQPAEESSGGAKKMVEDGVLENPKVNAALGMHIWPTIPAGKFGVKYGPLCAAPDYFKITIKGKGGHCAMPHKGIDPISVASQVYISLQTIISRRVDPVEPALITIGKFVGGTAFNIIPDEVVMEGTVRTLTNELREEMPKLIEKMVKGITEANDADYAFEYDPYYPPLINDNEMTSLFEKAAIEAIGEDNVVKIEKPTMGGEDFAHFQREDIPATFFIVGTQNLEKGTPPPQQPI